MKSNRYLIPIFILILGMAIFMQKMASQKTKSSQQNTEIEKVDTTKEDFLGQPVEQQSPPVQVQAAAPNPPKTIVDKEIEKCAPFLKISDQTNLFSQTLDQLKMKYGITKEEVDMTEYQLMTKSNEELVIQHIPSEESKNQVRVFKTAADGFPDRIKKFPNSNASEKLRLKGALTLGTLTKQIEKFKIVNADRSVLAYEKSNNEITRLDFTIGRNQLICEDQRCQCHEF